MQGQQGQAPQPATTDEMSAAKATADALMGPIFSALGVKDSRELAAKPLTPKLCKECRQQPATLGFDDCRRCRRELKDSELDVMHDRMGSDE